MASERVVRLGRADPGVAAQTLRDGIAAIRAELDVTPDFADDVQRAAERAAAAPRLPALDRTEVPLVTIDPESSRDLDQALHLARDGDGYVVSYAIADVAAFVTADDPVDLEARRRGQTLYGADAKIPLHPPTLSEGAGSLLPDQVRPALLWTVTLDAAGRQRAARVERAQVRSRAKLDYAGVQRRLDDGDAHESLQLLREIGELRLRLEGERGGVSLPLPEQEIETSGDRFSLEFRSPLPVEQYNAQISLLTGFAAAELMLGAGIGLLRTVPPADPRDVARLHRTAHALGIDWPDSVSYPDFIRSLDPAVPAHAAMVVACTRLLRGSGYVAFVDGPPEQPLHAALAAPYAHVTAPLRRLADRYAGEICLAVCAGRPVPDWVLARLADLPDLMRDSSRRANQYQNAIVDLVEAGVLQDRVGEEFTGVLVEVDAKQPSRGSITVRHPAIEAPITGEPLPLGATVTARLTCADPTRRQVEFELAGPPGS